ncbi:MAG: heme-dependent oxidative N-demethylase subunit alpha family protein, partial [Pseudomonadota bacterium]
MTLGFSVDELLPKARGGGQLKMGLSKLFEDAWLQPEPDLAERARGFAEFPEGVQLSSHADASGRELAAMLAVDGALPEAAKSTHEDMCLLTRFDSEEAYRLIGAAVAWPSDWRPADKLGLPLRALHAPIAGYKEQLASGVDHFMAKLKPGPI